MVTNFPVVLDDKDADWWERLVQSQLRVLINGINLDSSECLVERVKHLLLGYRALGPRPTSTSKPWPSYASADHSPIEYSLSISKERTILRLAIEPISKWTGTAQDPLNNRTIAEWLSRIGESLPHDLSWSRQLYPIIVADLPGKDLVGVPLTTQQGFGFDFNGNEAQMKMYMVPDVKAALRGSNDIALGKREIFNEALQACGFERGWRVIDDYLSWLHSTQSVSIGVPDMLAWDSCKPEDSRMKVYIRFQETDLEHALAHLDLGGSLDTEGIRCTKIAATEMWKSIAVEQPEEKIIVSNMECPTGRTLGFLVAYELRVGFEKPVAAKCI